MLKKLIININRDVRESNMENKEKPQIKPCIIQNENSFTATMKEMGKNLSSFGKKCLKVHL